jgi:hypothetical protein
MQELVKRIMDYLGPKFIGAAVISIPVLLITFIGTLALSVYRDQPFSFLGMQIGPSGPKNVDPGLSSPPVGTILPYIGKVTDLPLNWRVCDGSVLNDSRSTLFNGKPLPNLIDDRFLMGVNPAQVTDLTVVRGGSNEIPDGKHTHQGTATRNISQLDWAPGQQFQREGGTTAAHTHPVDIPESGSHNHGGENRPRFQGVVYIVRIW